MSDDVFLCFNCGQRNRVAAGSPKAAARCGACGDPLFPDAKAKAPTATTGTNASTHQKHTSSSQKNPSGRKPWILGLLVIGGVIWIASMQNPAGSPSSRATAPTVAKAETSPAIAEPLPPPVVQNAGIMWNATGRQAEAPLSILTSTGQDYYVKLVDRASGRDAMAVYIVGGRKIDVEVPLGSYILRYASGKTWRGETYLFGPGDLTAYNEAGSIFDFRVENGYLSGYTVELISQVNGNLSTKSLSAGQF